MGTVHFVDTSVFVALLDVPGRNERHEEVVMEYNLLKETDIFVLPLAVLVETGNHIAHVANGYERYEVANKFVSLVREAIEGSSNWNIMPEFSSNVLETILSKFPNQVKAQTGFGDVSIVEQFNEYWEKRQTTEVMRIWSFDAHLSGYSKPSDLPRRKYK